MIDFLAIALLTILIIASKKSRVVNFFTRNYGCVCLVLTVWCIWGVRAAIAGTLPGGDGGLSSFLPDSAGSWVVFSTVAIGIAIILAGWLFYRQFGLAMIRGLTEKKGKSMARDAMVRWLWKRCGDRRLKSVASIAKAARGLPIRSSKPRVKSRKVRVAANDNREGWVWIREAA